MASERLDGFWKDPKNWKGNKMLGYYSSKEDGRVVVPKRPPWAGWTINFAHRLAFPVLIGTFFLAVLPVFAMIAVFSNKPGILPYAVLIGIGLAVLLEVALARYLSNKEI